MSTKVCQKLPTFGSYVSKCCTIFYFLFFLKGNVVQFLTYIVQNIYKHSGVITRNISYNSTNHIRKYQVVKIWKKKMRKRLIQPYSTYF